MITLYGFLDSVLQVRVESHAMLKILIYTDNTYSEIKCSVILFLFKFMSMCLKSKITFNSNVIINSQEFEASLVKLQDFPSGSGFTVKYNIIIK